jgi:hypothetical protein
MNKEPKALVETQSQAPAVLIQQAITAGADLDKLEKALALQERWEANQAKKAYHLAMAKFKANPPKIDKDREVAFDTSHGKTRYSHASLFNVTEKINSALSEHGLSASWVTNQASDVISVTCRITHEKGHSEETTLSAKADTSGSKNPIQAIGSAITYLERYTLLALTGLATYEQDDDGQEAAPRPEEKKEKKPFSKPPQKPADAPVATKKDKPAVDADTDPRMITQAEFTALIITAVNNLYTAKDIEKSFTDLGYKIVNPLKKSSLVSDISPAINLWHYETILKEVKVKK